MQTQDLARIYATKSDQELLQLAADPDQLTPEALTVLRMELANRRLDLPRRSHLHATNDAGKPEDRLSRSALSLGPARGSGEFVKDVLGLYHRHFWFFVELVLPAVVIGYIAIFLGHKEGLEIVYRVFRGVVEPSSHITIVLRIWAANLTGYLISWMIFCASFAAICSAVHQIQAGGTPSLQESVGAVSERVNAFLRLSLLLFALFLIAELVARVLSLGVYLFSQQFHLHLGVFTAQILSLILVGLPLLVLARFGLAMPALILSRCRVGEAMFRSDELTEGKWLILAALLAKCLVGGYVAGMAPFWLASWIPAHSPMPSWFPWLLTGASLAAVTVVEPTMFIGFALLYLTLSNSPPAPNETLVRQLA